MNLSRIGLGGRSWRRSCVQLALAGVTLGIVEPGCTSDSGDGGAGGSTDAGADGTTDSGTDGSTDGASDADPDSMSDSGTDGATDGDTDADGGTDGPTVTIFLSPFATPRRIYRMPPSYASSEGLDEPTWSLTGGDGTVFANLLTGAVHNIDFYHANGSDHARGRVGANTMGDALEGFLLSYGEEGRSLNGFGDPFPPNVFTFGVTLVDTDTIDYVDAVGVQDPSNPEVTLGIAWVDGLGEAVEWGAPNAFAGSIVASVGGGELSSTPMSAATHFDGSSMVIEIVTAGGSLATAVDDGGFNVTEQTGFLTSAQQIRCTEDGYCVASDPDANAGVFIDATSSGVPPSILGQATVPGAFGVGIVDAGDYVVGCFTGSNMPATGEKFVCLTLDKNNPDAPPVESRFDVSELCQEPTFFENVQTTPTFTWVVACEADNQFIYVNDFPQLP